MACNCTISLLKNNSFCYHLQFEWNLLIHLNAIITMKCISKFLKMTKKKPKWDLLWKHSGGLFELRRLASSIHFQSDSLIHLNYHLTLILFVCRIWIPQHNLNLHNYDYNITPYTTHLDNSHKNRCTQILKMVWRMIVFILSWILPYRAS